MEYIFGLFILLLWAIWELDQYSQKNLDRRIDRASREGNTEELSRLIQVKMERQRREMDAVSQAEANQRYFDAFLVLDAADDGVFLPYGESVFDALNHQDNSGPQYDGNIDEDYYEDAYDPEVESDNHWGPV